MLKGLKWLIFLSLFIYVVVRAYLVPITHDEAYSYLLIKTNYVVAMAGTANTHWINSLGMKVGSLFLGDAPWQLRIFSVLAWLLYGYSAIKMSVKVNHRVLSLGFFILLVANPFLLDFFSLARGYGLASAFTLASIWKSLTVLEKEKWEMEDWVPAFFLGSLAVFSNYTTLYFFMALTGSYLLLAIYKQGWRQFFPIRFNKWLLIVGCTGIAAVSNLLFIKLYTGDLEYGGNDGLVHSIFGSLVSSSLYIPYLTSSTLFLAYLIFVLVTLVAVYGFYKFLIKKKVTQLVFICFITVCMLLFNVLFHVAFGTPYLLSRTTLVFYPCIVVLVFLGINEMTLPQIMKPWLLRLFSLVLSGIFIFNFLSNANLQYCYEWKEQADIKKCLDLVKDNGAHKVLIHKWYSGVFKNYYNVAMPHEYPFHITYFLPQEIVKLPTLFRKSFNEHDYAIVLPPFDLQQMRNEGLSFVLLQQFEPTGAAVLKIQK